MRKIFVSTTFIKDKHSVFEAIDLLKKIKIKNIELGSNHIYEKKINKIIKYKLNFIVHNYFPVPRKDFVINIASLNNKIRKKSIEQIKKSIKFTKIIRGKLYTFHPGFYTDPDGAKLNKKNYDFLWRNKKIKKDLKKESITNMINSIKEIIDFSKKTDVKIAIETEGSYYAKDHLMMQLPQDYLVFKKNFSYRDIGVNLNLAHLNLASRAFGFSKKKFIGLVKKYIVAIELSHNTGLHDSHQPLQKNAWYLDFIRKNIPNKVPLILEFRNSEVKDIINSLNIIKCNY